MGKKVVIIGAGFAGLSSAILLSKAGYEVTIVEKNDQPGGRAIVLEKEGYHFDLGPSWYMMPDVFENFFKEIGENISDYYELKKLDPGYRIFHDSDNSVIDVPEDINKVYDLFETLEPGSSANLKKYLEKSKRKYELGINNFIRKPYSSWSELITRETMSQAFSMDLHKSFADVVRENFKNPKIRQILEYPSVFLGGSPKNIWALFNVISHADFGLKIWYPMGGFGVVSRALEKICLKNNVTIKYEEPAVNIKIEEGRAQKVTTTKGEYAADIVCACCDYEYAEVNLLEKKYQSIKKDEWNKKIMSPSCLLIYLGVGKKIPNLEHHTYFFNDQWDEHIDSIYKNPAWPVNPQFYIHCPSKTDPTVAPSGKEVLFILMPVAAGIEDYPAIREKYFEKLVAKIEEKTGCNFKNEIEFKKIWGPNNLKSTYNAYKGNAFGLALTFKQSLIFRPNMKSKKVQNLYFGGHYTNPGTGTPLAIISGQILSDLITKNINV